MAEPGGDAPIARRRAPRHAISARYWEIDAARGLAVVLMVIFHLMWDLHFVGWSSVDIFSPAWQAFARSIGTSFTLLLGISLSLTAARLSGWNALWRYSLRRSGILLALGMLITLITYLTLPESYVRFGILHLLGASLLLATPFVWTPRWITLTVSAVVIIGGIWLNTMVVSYPWLIWLGVTQAGIAMADYYPVLPWGGAALLGLSLGQMLYPHGRRRMLVPNYATYALVRGLGWLGRHSLIIYLLHQPILLGAIWLLSPRR